MIPTTVSSSPSTATISGTTGNNHNNGTLNSFSTVTPTTSTVFASATSPQTTQTSSIMLGLAALILEGRAVADDEFQPHTTRTTAVTNDANSFSGSGTGQGTSSSSSNSGVGGSSSHNYNTNSLLASTSYGILSGSSSGSAAVGGGRQSPTCRPSTSRAAASFCSSSASGSDGITARGHVINITTNPYAFNNNNNNSASGAYASRGDPRPLYIDPYTNSDSASSSAESTHQRWTQKLCQLRQVSPAASLSTAYEQPVTVEAREPELVALAINESGASERGEFEIVRRTLLNRANLNAMSGGGAMTAATASSAGAGSAGSSPSSGSGSDNFLLSLQSLATTCLRSGSPSLEPSGSASTTSTPNAYRYAALSSPPPQHSMYIYRANTPTPTAQNRFHDQHGSASSCGSGVQSPRPHWSAAAGEHNSMLHAREKYMRHVANSGLSLGTGRLPIPGTAVNATIGGTTIAAAAATPTNIGNTTKMATASATAAAMPLSSSSKYPQQGPHCDQFLKKMGLAKGEAAEAEDHICDSSNLNLSCSRWRAYCNRIESIMARGEPVCIEVYLGPMNHKILLEQWIITQKEKVPPPTMTLSSLCSAIRSQLYFSQISAWCDLIKKSDQTIYDTGRIIFSAPTGAAGDLATPIGSAAVGAGGSSNSGTSTPSAGVGVGVIGNTNHNINITPGTSPNSHTLNQLNNLLLVNERPRLNIYYRIKSFDSTACFNSKPNVHNFPNVNISENCSISVCLKSLPRINGGIPKIGTLMLSNPGAVAVSITTTTTITTMSATTSSKTKRNDTTKTITTTIAAITTMPSSSSASSSSTMAASMQLLTAANGSTNNSNTNKFRNGNSQSFTPSSETPRSSRAAALTATSFRSEAPSTSTASLATTSSAAKSRVFIKSPSIDDTPLAKSASTTSASSKSSTSSATNSSTHNNAPSFSNSKSDTSASDLANSSSDSNASHIGATSSPATTKHKCSFFIGEEELHAVDEADGDIEAYCDEDDNRSDTANSTADSMTSTSALSSSGHMSHREKQLMKYRKRMLKRDKKHQHQYQQQPKPLTTTSDATYELGSTSSTELASKQQEQQRTLNGCQPMDEGDEDDACVTLVTSHSSSAQIEMISTGTQTTMSCCRQCGCEKTLICLRCTAGGSGGGSSEQRREQAIENPTEQKGVAADDMDDSTASSLSSSEIISTPRNKAELLLQAIQRTPKVAAAKHKNEQPRHPCGSGGAKAHNNIQLKAGQTVNGADDFTTGSGCQVCKRQKTQHNFGNSNGALELNASNGELLTDKASDDGDDDGNIGDDTDEDDDDDGGRSHTNNTINATTDANQDLTTPLTVLAPGAELMEEESFISSTKLTPQIDRCTLSTNSNNSASYEILTTGERVGLDQAIDACSRPGNRTPPTITTYMEGDECCYDESQFRTPTSNATNLIRNELTPLQQQQHAQKAMPHKLTPKPNLLQLHCNYRDEMSVGDSMQSVGASGDGYGMLSTTALAHNSVAASKPQKQQSHPGSASTLLLRSKGLPKVNLTPIFCNPMPTTMSCSGVPNSRYSLPIPIHGATNYDNTTFCFEPTMLQLSGNQMQLHHQLMQSSNGSNFCASPLVSTTTDANNIPVQKSFSAPTLPNSPSLSPRFAKQAAIYKRRSRHLSDRSDRSSLGSDEQFSDEDLESAGMYSPATSPLKQCARVAATFGRQPLLGNLEESLLQKRLMPKVEVLGFKVLLGASGGFCPTQLTIPAAAYFYELQGETLSTPYVCEIRLPRKGYSVPRAGTVQATLLNPMGTVVRMFVIPYDMRDMPPLHQTFIRQRILAEASSNEAATQNVQSNQNANAQYASGGHMPAYTNGFGGGGGGGGDDNLNINNNNSECYQNNNNNNNTNTKTRYRLSPSGGLHGESNLGHFISAEHMKRLRYSIHLRFQTSRSGRLSLHTDIRLLISRRTEYDTAAAHAKGVLEAPNDLVTDTVMPTNPRYSARQDQSSSGGSGSSSTSTNIIVATALTANSSNNTTLTTTATTTTTTHNNNGSASNKI